MTRENAIKILESILFLDIEKDEALHMAIESLEQCEMAYEHGWTDAESEYRKILERKRGEWIEDGYQGYPCVCSVCGTPQEIKAKFLFSFCPNCGADMRKILPKH